MDMGGRLVHYSRSLFYCYVKDHKDPNYQHAPLPLSHNFFFLRLQSSYGLLCPNQSLSVHPSPDSKKKKKLGVGDNDHESWWKFSLDIGRKDGLYISNFLFERSTSSDRWTMRWNFFNFLIFFFPLITLKVMLNSHEYNRWCKTDVAVKKIIM